MSEENPIVYVPQVQKRVIRDGTTNSIIGIGPAFDISPAEQFGKIKVLFDQGILENIKEEELPRFISQSIAHYTSQDYILPTGKSWLVALVVAAAAHINQGEVNLLLWDAASKVYVPKNYIIE